MENYSEILTMCNDCYFGVTDYGTDENGNCNWCGQRKTNNTIQE